MLSKRRLSSLAKSIIEYCFEDGIKKDIVNCLQEFQHAGNVDFSDEIERAENIDSQSDDDWSVFYGDVVEKMKNQRNEKEKIFDVFLEAIDDVKRTRDHPYENFYHGEVEGILSVFIELGLIDEDDDTKLDFRRALSSEDIDMALDAFALRLQNKLGLS